MRRHAYGRGAALLLPGAGAAGWYELHAPLGTAGLAGMAGAGLALGLMVPAFLLTLRELPLLLVPKRLIIWWREGYDRRPHIPTWLRYAVHSADGWRCCYCGDGHDLQLDHVRPWSRGGLTLFWNLLTLCGRCNRVKSNYWVARDGYVFYRPFRDANDMNMAAAILRYEKRHRLSPLRWIRAGWSLSS